MPKYFVITRMLGVPEYFTETTAPDWLCRGGVKGSTMDNRWFWEQHVLTLDVGQSVSTDHTKITRLAENPWPAPLNVWRVAAWATWCQITRNKKHGLSFLKCDTRGCLWTQFHWHLSKADIGRPCPKCGSNLLTREDARKFLARDQQEACT